MTPDPLARLFLARAWWAAGLPFWTREAWAHEY